MTKVVRICKRCQELEEELKYWVSVVNVISRHFSELSQLMTNAQKELMKIYDEKETRKTKSE